MKSIHPSIHPSLFQATKPIKTQKKQTQKHRNRRDGAVKHNSTIDTKDYSSSLITDKTENIKLPEK